MRNVMAALVGVAAVFAVSSADAALISGSSGPFAISGNGGSQAFGVNLAGGAVGDTFNADFLFTVADVSAASGGATSIENVGNPADLKFTSIALYDSSNTLLATGSVGTFGVIDAAEIGSLTVFPGLTLGGSYYVRTSGTFLKAGNASIGGTVSLTPVPVPAALPLFLTALAGVGLISRRENA